jgi:hypothetical protein
MARVLKFTDPAMFSMFMEGFLNTEKQDKDVRIASKFLDLIDEISHPKYSLEDLSEEVLENHQAKMLALSIRKLNDGGGEVIIDDKTYEYVKDCIKKAGWKHFAAQEGFRIEKWVCELSAVKVKKEGTKLVLVKDEPEIAETESSGSEDK